jgi:hypothetical protein
MFPRPMGNYTRVVITGAVSVLLPVPQVIAGVRLFAGRGYPGFGPLPTFLFAMLALLQFTPVFAIVQLVRTEHDLQAAVGGDDRVAPAMLTQPDPLQAVRDGDHLILTRSMRRAVFWRGLGLVALLLIPCVAIAYIGEAIVFLAAPHASGWILAWVFNRREALMFVSPPHLTPLEWFLVLVPVVLAFAVCIFIVWEQLSARRQVITVGDQGVTVKWFLSRRAFIPWSDIRLLVNARFGAYSGVSYWLRGDRHGVILDLGTSVPTMRNGKPRRPVYEYEGGIDEYETNIQRLLATITVRAHVPLRTWATGYYQLTRNQETTPIGLTADEVAAMPVASALSQPSAASIAQVAASTEPFTLCANVPVRVLLRQATVYGSSIGILLLLFMLVTLALVGGSFSRAFPGPGEIILVALMLCLFYSIGLLVAVPIYRNGNPAITADANGLTARGYNREKLGAVGWKDIRTWAIVQTDPGVPESITYAVYTDRDTLTWTDPANARLVWQRVAGDRHAAYRAAAEKLHATIAARTGLPLHVIAPRQ